jgi:hypothetical protein
MWGGCAGGKPKPRALDTMFDIQHGDRRPQRPDVVVDLEQAKVGHKGRSTVWRHPDLDDRDNLALRQGLAHASMFEETVGSSAALRRVLAQNRRRGMLGCARLTSNGVQSLPKANLKSR